MIEDPPPTERQLIERQLRGLELSILPTETVERLRRRSDVPRDEWRFWVGAASTLLAIAAIVVVVALIQLPDSPFDFAGWIAALAAILGAVWAWGAYDRSLVTAKWQIVMYDDYPRRIPGQGAAIARLLVATFGPERVFVEHGGTDPFAFAFVFVRCEGRHDEPVDIYIRR